MRLETLAQLHPLSVDAASAYAVGEGQDVREFVPVEGVDLYFTATEDRVWVDREDGAPRLSVGLRDPRSAEINAQSRPPRLAADQS